MCGRGGVTLCSIHRCCFYRATVWVVHVWAAALNGAQLSSACHWILGLASHVPILIHINFLFGSFEPVEKTLDCASKIVEKVGTSREKLLWAFLNTFEEKIQIIVSTKIIVSKKIIVSNKIIISIIFQGISFSSLDIALLVWNLCRPIPQP